MSRQERATDMMNIEGGRRYAAGHPRPTGSPTARLAAANHAIREGIRELDEARARRRQARRGVEAIDVVLESMEQYHLARRPRDVGLRPIWRDHLEKQGGLSIPAHILEVRHTVRVHDALLTWQDALFNELVPGRRELAQADERRELEIQVLAADRSFDRSAA